jgi:glycosyltransferase involved in cell wall biosynthesis
MRICLFAESIDKKDGGPSRSVPLLARGLSEIGIDTTLMTVETDEMNTHLLENTDVNLLVIPRKASQKYYVTKIREGGYDIIHSQCIWLPEYHKVAVAARKLGVPLIITPRGTLEPWAYQGQGLLKSMKKRIAMMLYQKNDIQKAACVLATAFMEAQSIRSLGIKSPIAVIPNGIDISEYGCRLFDFKKNVKKQILFLSRIHQKKGIEFLIDAWNALHDVYPDWKVIIAGNGDETYISHLNELVITKKLQHCITILPPLFGEEKYKLYCESSLFVLPTYSENFGMVIAEAMSCGVPVITTNGTPWQDLNSQKIGWCIDLNIENLINAIKEAINLGPDILFDMGQKCSQYISKTYHYTNVARKNKELYIWVLNSIEKPSFVL